MTKKILIINASKKDFFLPEKEEKEIMPPGESEGEDTSAGEALQGADAQDTAEETMTGSEYEISGFRAEHEGELSRIEKLMLFLRETEKDDYSGIVIFSEKQAAKWIAAFMSFLLCDIAIPVISADIDAAEKLLKKSRKLIFAGLAPNVYLLENGSGKKASLSLGSHVGAESAGNIVFPGIKDNKKLFKKCAKLSDKRFFSRVIFMNTIKKLDGNVLFVREYPGMDYSRLPLFGVKAVIFKGISSGKVPEYLAYECYRRGISVFSENNISAKALYAKAVIGVSIGFRGKDLSKFIDEEINNEYTV